MSHFRYSAAHKIDAVRRVVEDGRRVCDVARELGVSEGSLFFWVRRYREFLRDARVRGPSSRNPPGGPRAAAPSLEPATLVAYLRRAGAG